MATLTSEAQIVACFRRIDRRAIELAPDLRLPIHVDDVFAWAVGPRAFLLFRERRDTPVRGIVFHRATGGGGHLVMCQWCRSVRGDGAIKLMSVHADSRHTLGVYVCADLGCVGRAREQLGAADVARTLGRIVEFADRCLG